MTEATKSRDQERRCREEPSFMSGRTIPQNARMHAMIGDISRQFVHAGRKWDADDMKRLLIDQFRRDTLKDPDLVDEWRKVAPLEMAPSIDGTGVVMLGAQSRRFTKKLASAFCEWLFAFGAEIGVTWSDPTIVPLEAYQQEAA